LDKRKRPLHSDDAEQFRAIGQAIRDTRHGRYTLETLASRAGISIGQLSQIENGRGNPTVEMLIRIGAAFRIDAVDFIERRVPAPTQVIRVSERRRHVLGDNREIAMLTPGLRYEFTVSYLEFEPGESRQSLAFAGDNVFYVLEGQLSVHVGGSTYVLEEEDALVCRTAERLTNAATQPTKFIACFRPEDE
jgi:transcriptional regulator with XRE-family HTH domain